MKKLFFVILAGGIIFTACKKDEKEINKNFDSSFESNSLKNTPQDTLGYYYHLVQTNVYVDSVLCNKYVSNTDTSSFLYIPTGNDKSIFRKYKWDAWINLNTGKLECNRDQLKECYGRADGSICVKRNANLNINS